MGIRETHLVDCIHFKNGHNRDERINSGHLFYFLTCISLGDHSMSNKKIKKSPHSGTIVPEWGLFVNSGHYEMMIIMEMIIDTIKKSPHPGTIVPKWSLIFLNKYPNYGINTLRC